MSAARGSSTFGADMSACATAGGWGLSSSRRAAIARGAATRTPAPVTRRAQYRSAGDGATPHPSDSTRWTVPTAHLDRQQHMADLQRWGPLVLQDVQADAAQLVDVGVVDLGQEAHLRRTRSVRASTGARSGPWLRSDAPVAHSGTHLRRAHRVVVGQEELQLKDAACDGRASVGAAEGDATSRAAHHAPQFV